VSNGKKLLDVLFEKAVSGRFCLSSLQTMRSAGIFRIEGSRRAPGLDARITSLAFAAPVARKRRIPVGIWRDQQRWYILRLLRRAACRVDEKAVVETSGIFRLDATGACDISRSRCDAISIGPSHGG
jgi:hypothetical protein